ncbi:MAG TPA: efflux transporter outer membrane subunit [Caulobacteraceae bacterium]|nr:efflux transporter outer membrane subunit [Caulobacteraceae bacterium]
MKRLILAAIGPLTLSALALSACAVGPDFHAPPAPTLSRYTPEPLPAATGAAATRGGADQSFVQGQDVSGQWWTLFGSPALDALVTRALKANPDLAAAREALRAAHENYLAQRGALLPTADAGFSASRQQASGTPAPPLASNNNLFTLYTAQLTIAYVPDLFGGVRRQVETTRAQADAQRFETEAVYLTLTTNVVAGAIQEGSLAEQIEATRQVIKAETEALGILRRQKALGQVGGLDVAAQESALAQAEATLPPLEKQLAQQRDQMAYLTGRAPSEAPEAPLDLGGLTLPAALPVSLPSRLVEQRPDVRAAEANLHAATAQVGVAIANRLPNVTLTADAGGASTSLASLFTRGNGFWGLAANVAQPIYQGGTLLHRQKAAEAALAQAREQYRAAVLAAFQNVADTLQALQADSRALAAAARAEKSAEATLAISRRQLALGQVSGPSVLLAEQAYQQALVGRLQAEAGRYADTVALFQALGGGWWNRKDV